MSYQLDPGIEIRIREVKAQNIVAVDNIKLWDKYITQNVTLLKNNQVYDKITLAKWNTLRGRDSFVTVGDDIIKDHPKWMWPLINEGYSIIEYGEWYALVPREVLLGNK